MNGNHILRMAMRMVLNRGINAGMDKMARRGRDPKDMSPTERATAQQSRKNMGNARRGINMIRRMTQF